MQAFFVLFDSSDLLPMCSKKQLAKDFAMWQPVDPGLNRVARDPVACEGHCPYRGLRRAGLIARFINEAYPLRPKS